MSATEQTPLVEVAPPTAASTPKPPTFKERMADLATVPMLYGMGSYFFTKTLLKTLFTTPLSFSWESTKHASFAQFWKLISSPTLPESPLFPFLALQSTASGTVLDLGPGTGEQLQHFSASNVEKIYGAEPTIQLHDVLSTRIAKEGLEGKYEVLHCGAEWDSIVPALKLAGVIGEEAEASTEVFDTIVCSKVLCSVPSQKDTVRGLYKLLKPGGRLLINEHIKNRASTHKEGSWRARLVQVWAMTFGWKSIMGNCCLNRETAKVIEEVGQENGGWGEKKLDFVAQWSTIPFVFGWFEKRRD